MCPAAAGMSCGPPKLEGSFLAQVALSLFRSLRPILLTIVQCACSLCGRKTYSLWPVSTNFAAAAGSSTAQYLSRMAWVWVSAVELTKGWREILVSHSLFSCSQMSCFLLRLTEIFIVRTSGFCIPLSTQWQSLTSVLSKMRKLKLL